MTMKKLVHLIFYDWGKGMPLGRRLALYASTCIIGGTIGYLFVEASDFSSPIKITSAVLLIISFAVLNAVIAYDLLQKIQVESENYQKTMELTQARELQMDMVPDEPPEIDGFQISVSMETATEVGGDYYDFLHHDDHGHYVVLGDATGHGMKAGIMVAMTKMGLISALQLEPEKMLENFNRNLQSLNLKRINMALMIARLKDQKLHLAMAGMPPVIHYRNESKSSDTISIPALPLGNSLQSSYESINTKLHSGDILVMMSDGLSERKDPTGNEIPLSHLIECIETHSHGSAGEINHKLRRLSDQWASEKAITDDQTVIVIKCDLV